MAYEVSVITPFHNVDIDVFKRGINSMLSQTIGFSNVEWIIVIHNSGQEYHDALHGLLDQYDNVRLERWDNNVHTPSSPRNRGIELASAPYIAFLDGDDQYTPSCLQKVLYHMKKNDAQITWFRREYELESPDSVPITEIVLWDQTREEIIVDKDHWDDEKIFSGICGMVTSRMYSKKFIDSNNLRFDETVPFAEDYLFNIECYGHADKICYLPQTIGYHYFINGGSLVQSKGKSGETLLAYAKGYKKVFEAGFSYGFYMNAIVLGLCCVLARFLISTDDITLEQRIEIKNILEPYLRVMTPLKVSKIYSEKAVKERFDFPRDVILNPEKYDKNVVWDSLVNIDIRSDTTLSPYQMVLRNILSANQGTDFGKRYGFSDILTMSGYQSKVPVSVYDFYEPLIKLQTNIGESGIFTSGTITDYLITSNSLGMRKLFPCTKEHIDPLNKAVIKMLKGHHTIPLFVCIPKKEKFNDNSYSNSCMGEILAGVVQYIRHDAINEREIFSSPIEILFPANVKKIYYPRILFALKERDADQIFAANSWSVIEFFAYIEKHWEKLCRDIENGTISKSEDIEDELLDKLNGYLKPDKERADELRAIFNRGFDEPVAHKIWNKLECIIADSEGCYEFYKTNLKKYIGNIQVTNGLYSLVGSLIGKEKDGIYELCTDNTFTEFAETFDNGSEGRVLLSRDVNVGSYYELIITCASGLYRYKTGETVKIEKVIDEIPFFSGGYRINQSVVDKDIVITEKDIRSAVIRLISEKNVEVMDFVYLMSIGSNASRRLQIYLETNEDTKELGKILDEYLCEMNSTYKAARVAGKIDELTAIGLEVETQLLYRDIVMKRTGLVPEIIDPVRLIDTPVKEKFFTANVKRD